MRVTSLAGLLLVAGCVETPQRDFSLAGSDAASIPKDVAVLPGRDGARPSRDAVADGALVRDSGPGLDARIVDARLVPLDGPPEDARLNRDLQPPRDAGPDAREPEPDLAIRDAALLPPDFGVPGPLCRFEGAVSRHEVDIRNAGSTLTATLGGGTLFGVVEATDRRAAVFDHVGVTYFDAPPYRPDAPHVHFADDRFYVAQRLVHPDGGEWGTWMQVFWDRSTTGPGLSLTGVNRPTGHPVVHLDGVARARVAFGVQDTELWDLRVPREDANRIEVLPIDARNWDFDDGRRPAWVELDGELGVVDVDAQRALAYESPLHSFTAELPTNGLDRIDARPRANGAMVAGLDAARESIVWTVLGPQGFGPIGQVPIEGSRDVALVEVGRGSLLVYPVDDELMAYRLDERGQRLSERPMILGPADSEVGRVAAAGTLLVWTEPDLNQVAWVQLGCE